MLVSEPTSIIEMQFQKSYANMSRSDENIRMDLSNLLNDYSLADEVTSEMDDLI